MKTVSYHLSPIEKLNEDIIILFDPNIYNNIDLYRFRSNHKNYNTTPIYVKPGLILNNYHRSITTKEILTSSLEASIRDINKELLSMTREEAMLYLELEGYVRVYLHTDLSKL